MERHKLIPSAISGMDNRFAQGLVTKFATDIASIGAENQVVRACVSPRVEGETSVVA